MLPDWTCFRGTPYLKGDLGGPFSDRPKLLWTKDIGGAVESTAAVVGGVVYVGNADGQLVALNLKDGSRKWVYKATDKITASPCVTNGLVCVGDEGGVFHAVKASTGKLAWKYTTGDKIISSATPYRGSVLLGSYDNYLYRFDTATGSKIWSFRTDAQVHCTPCVIGGTAIIDGCDGILRMIDVERGREKSSAEIGGNYAASPAYSQGAVFVGSMNGEYFGVRVSDGKILWRVISRKNGGASFGSGAVSGNYVVFGSRNKSVFCLDRDTGTTRWVFRTWANWIRHLSLPEAEFSWGAMTGLCTA